jgi:hypothetical protein
LNWACTFPQIFHGRGVRKCRFTKYVALMFKLETTYWTWRLNCFLSLYNQVSQLLELKIKNIISILQVRELASLRRSPSSRTCTRYISSVVYHDPHLDARPLGALPPLSIDHKDTGHIQTYKSITCCVWLARASPQARLSNNLFFKGPGLPVFESERLDRIPPFWVLVTTHLTHIAVPYQRERLWFTYLQTEWQEEAVIHGALMG